MSKPPPAAEPWQETARAVERARNGDEAAFRELLESHGRAISSTLFACGVRCPETARDLAQEVAIRAWTSLDRLKDARTFRAWIRRIAANAARDHLRRLAVRREEGLQSAVNIQSGDDPHASVERLAEMRFMLAALEHEDDEVVELLLARAEGVTIHELAHRLELSEAALKMRLMRVRKRLRKRLQQLRLGH